MGDRYYLYSYPKRWLDLPLHYPRPPHKESHRLEVWQADDEKILTNRVRGIDSNP